MKIFNLKSFKSSFFSFTRQHNDNKLHVLLKKNIGMPISVRLPANVNMNADKSNKAVSHNVSGLDSSY